jgi:uncharacterized protein with ParB-like and HNH nuclease domain
METVKKSASEEDVLDEAGLEDVPFSYKMTNWGADYALETLVQRLQKGIIFVPPFQRNYVWDVTQASRFMESLLIGLPVPGVFLYKEEDTGKLLIVDGQQRLQTIRMFYEGMFEKREFALEGVSKDLEGKTYQTLNEEQRNNLNDTIIHATIVRQEVPEDDNSSVYQIFERLNTGGTQLQPQEIRASIFHGPFSEFLQTLNSNSAWRTIFGPPSSRMKDQELILRFLAFRFSADSYQRPLNTFLNSFMSRHRNLSATRAAEFHQAFKLPCEQFAKTLGKKAFRPKAALNAAVFDSMMIGLSEAQSTLGQINDEVVQRQYDSLLTDQEYLHACSRATGDQASIGTRFSKARAIFLAP